MAAEREAVPIRSDTELTRETRPFVPDVDIYETEQHLVLEADVPGVRPDGLDVSLEDNILTIDGRAGPIDVGERKLVHAEYKTGDYHRAFTLAEGADQDKIEALLQGGVLTVRVPAAQQAKVKRIPVSVSS